jgi:hypothetical protein
MDGGWGEVKADELKVLEKDFRDYLNQRMPQPSSATKSFLDYLNMHTMDIYVRGEKAEGKEAMQWFLQVSFSGCAGMTEIAAEVGYHWASMWYTDRKDRLTQAFLAPFGFYPNDKQSIEVSTPFLPLQGLGHAAYYKPEPADDEKGSLVMDDAQCQTPEGEEEAKRLEDKYLSLMSDDLCRCQLCMPEFQPVPTFVR